MHAMEVSMAIGAEAVRSVELYIVRGFLREGGGRIHGRK